jgi:hypothetical protein
MKKYTVYGGDATLFVGTAREIRSLFNNLDKRDIAWAVFSGAPKFNEFRMYGLLVECYDTYREEYYAIPHMCVVNADTALNILMDEV